MASRRLCLKKDVLLELGRRLLDGEEVFAKRYRCLFSLMNCEPSVETRFALIQALREKEHGALLRHEVAYVLGQMQDRDEEVVNLLKHVVQDEQDDVMVRHEAAEALGNIADCGAEDILRQHECDKCRELAETCQLALRRIEDERNADAIDTTATQEQPIETAQTAGETSTHAQSQFNTVDPTLVSYAMQERDVDELERIVLNESLSMHDRYEAIFAIRNKGGKVAVDLLTKCLVSSKSALLKHEVAFVLGQLQNEQATEILVKILRDKSEHAMVRHEAAEALGSVAESDQKVFQILEEYCKDDVLAVAQSCEVALDMLKNKDEFEYCETLTETAASA